MQRTSSCTWVKALLAMFAAEGADTAGLLRAAGMQAERLQRPSERFGADEVTLLWELAIARTGNVVLGLDRDLCARHVDFDVLGYAMLSSPDLRDALSHMARYMAVISDAASFELVASGSDEWLVLGGSGYTRPVPPQRYAYGLLALLLLCEWLTRRPLVPQRIEFKFPAPQACARYADVFRCDVRFGCGENRMLLHREQLRSPIPSRNAALLTMHEDILRKRVDALGSTRVSCRVSEEVMRSLSAGEPRREQIAARLAITDRTLQRRLHEEGTSFQRLLDDARRELASKYLADEHRSLAEIAQLLSFVDQSNFVRASKRWFGEPPGRIRRRMHDAAPRDERQGVG